MVKRCTKLALMFACAIPVMFLTLASCGGGGGGGGGGSNAPVSTAPTLSDLILAPARAPVNADGTSTLFGSFKFADPKGDITSVTATILDGTGTVIGNSFGSIPDLSGQTQGTADFTIKILSDQLGNYRVKITATDMAGQQSNVLEADFKVIENPWTAKTPMPTPRAGLAVAALNGKIYALGGYDNQLEHDPMQKLQEYNPDTGTWTEKAPMPTGRNCLAMVNIGNKLYAVGGLANGEPKDVLEVYDSAANTWTTESPMPTPRSDLGVVELQGMLYAIGGRDDKTQTDLATVEKYDPITKTWEPVASMNTPRYSPAVGVINGKIYAAGGTAGDDYASSIEEYDPASNTWTTKEAIMPTQPKGLIGAVANGWFYVIGGLMDVTDGTETNGVYRYDPAADIWEIQSRMLTARYDLASGILNDRIYAIGGRTIDGVFSDAIEEYDPVKDN